MRQCSLCAEPNAPGARLSYSAAKSLSAAATENHGQEAPSCAISELLCTT